MAARRASHKRNIASVNTEPFGVCLYELHTSCHIFNGARIPRVVAHAVKSTKAFIPLLLNSRANSSPSLKSEMNLYAPPGHMSTTGAFSPTTYPKSCTFCGMAPLCTRVPYKSCTLFFNHFLFSKSLYLTYPR